MWVRRWNLQRRSEEISAESYLRERGEDTGEFILIQDYHGGITSQRYVAGAIRLRIGELELMGLREWDYIDQLWAYLLRCLQQIASGKVGQTYFPDQPIEVKMTPHPNGSTVQLTVGDTRTIRSAEALLKSLIAVLAAEAERFYEKMEALVPGDAEFYRHFRSQAAALLDKC